MRRLNAFQLKIIGVVCMVLDHVAWYMHPAFPEWLYLSFRYAGRLVVPIFFFLLVEGFYHTRVQGRYIRRLWTWAGMMMGLSFLWLKLWDVLLGRPDTFYLHGFAAIDVFFYNIGLNILLTLACCTSVFWCIHSWHSSSLKKRIGIFVALLALSILFFIVEGSYFMLVIALSFFIPYGNRARQWIGFMLIECGVIGFNIIMHYDPWVHGYQWMMIFALPLLMLYSGERGPNTSVHKYFFYIFYIAQAWILYAIARCLGFR